MTLHLCVADRLEPLAERAAEVLALAPDDPFVRDVVAVPGDGVRTWLVQRLARRVGASSHTAPDGIVANVEFVFPGALVRRALGRTGDSPWSIGPLTWAVFDLMHTHGELLGLPVDAVRARAIADLFDRYGLHRAAMVRSWERGHDVDAVGAPLAPSARWQPQLWRLLVERLGVASDAALLPADTAALRAHPGLADLPSRVVSFGLASMPAAHLEVLTALAAHREVHLLAPAASLDWWHRLEHPAVALGTGSWPRGADPAADVVTHRLARTWARAGREAHLLLRAAVHRAGPLATVDTVPPAPTSTDTTLLAIVQQAIRTDTDPPGPPTAGAPDLRPPLHPDDRSVQWHRCHGLTRQVEVLRDVILRLLDAPPPPGGVALEPRDISIVCPDVAAVAALAEAVFAGDGPDGAVPALPLRVADRSIRSDVALLDAVAALFDFVDGRFRAGQVLAYAARPPVSARFGFTPERLGTVVGWVEALPVRWGLDASRRSTFGLPEGFAAGTWQAGLDQLLLGAAMADSGPRVGPGSTVPFGDIEGDVVEVAGDLADFVDRLGRAVARLSVEQPVAAWCDALRDAALQLCALDDLDSWQWSRLESELTRLAADATIDGYPVDRPVPPQQMAALLAARLGGRPGRPRFGSGAITLSSLTAQRGVPHRVVCLLGFDTELGGGAASADDLMAAQPCLGDRDARSEGRAQLLDAVLSAGEHLVICSTGRDLRTNADVPPTVALAEFADLVDASVVPPLTGPASSARRASDAIAVAHPRQAWSERNFIAGELGIDGPWGFDAAARTAAISRRAQADPAPLLPHPLPPDRSGECDLAGLHLALTEPVRRLLSVRLGVAVADEATEPDDAIALSLDGLEHWHLADALLSIRLDTPPEHVDETIERWIDVEQARGALPPFGFGAQAIASARNRADGIAAMRNEVLAAEQVPTTPTTRAVEYALADGRLVMGEVSGVHGHLVVTATVSALSPKHRLAAWLRLALLTGTAPDIAWQALLVGTKGTGDNREPVVERLALRSPADAVEVLHTVVDLFDRSGADLIPFFPATSEALHRRDRSAALSAWRPDTDHARGDADDRWVQFAFGPLDLDDLLRLPPRADEAGPTWGDEPSRAHRWADRVWSTYQRTTTLIGVDDDH